MHTLCELTGVLARDGQCVAHGGDACLKVFVPADPEWHKLRAQRDGALSLARLIERDLGRAIRTLGNHNRRWRHGFRNVLGDYRPGPLEDPDGT